MPYQMLPLSKTKGKKGKFPLLKKAILLRDIGLADLQPRTDAAKIIEIARPIYEEAGVPLPRRRPGAHERRGVRLRGGGGIAPGWRRTYPQAEGFSAKVPRRPKAARQVTLATDNHGDG